MARQAKKPPATPQDQEQPQQQGTNPARTIIKPPTRKKYTPQDHDAAYKDYFSLSLVIESIFTDMGEALGFDPEFTKKLNFREAKSSHTESIKETPTEKGKARQRQHNDLHIEIPSLVAEDNGEPLHVIFEFYGSWPAGVVNRMMDSHSEVFKRLQKPRKPTDPPPQVLCILIDHSHQNRQGPRVPKMNIYDNDRPGMQIRGTHPERRLDVFTLNLDGMPIDNPMSAWCHIEQARVGDDKKVIAVLKAVFTKYSNPSGEEDLLCQRLYHRATMHGFCCKNGIPVSYEQARREILGGKDMPYMTNVQRSMLENVQKGERRGERRGLRRGRQEGRQEGWQEGRQEGQRELLCSQAEKKFNGHTSKQLATLLQSVDDPVVLDQVAENIIVCDTGRKFINACKRLNHS